VTDSATHPRDSLQDLLDGRLTTGQSQEVGAHLASCSRCRAELESLRALGTLLQRARSAPEDSAFDARLRAALDTQDRATGAPRLGRSRRWLVGAGAAAAAVLLLFFVAREPAPEGLPAAALAEFENLREDRLAVTHRDVGAVELRESLERDGLSFALRVLDLGAMGWRLDGGRVSSLDGRTSGLLVYRDAAGRLVLCEMLEGRLHELPKGAAFEAGGISFLVYRRGDVTAIFWAEGPVLCALVSDLPEAELRQLAIAKAMLPT